MAVGAAARAGAGKQSTSSSSHRKRPRPKKQGRGFDAEDEEDYYRRLLHSCRKDLHKQAKRCKSFQCQKLIRKLKQRSNEKGQTGSVRAANTAAAVTDDPRLLALKAIAVEAIVDECLQRIGILHVAPSAALAATTSSATPDQNADVMESILRHKHMRDCLEKWNEQVSNYRTWCRNRKSGPDGDRAKGTSSTNQDVSYEASIFAQLGGASTAAEGLEEQEGDDNDIEDVEAFLTAKPKKKNRAGQRARRARAMALEAREDPKGGHQRRHGIDKRVSRNQKTKRRTGGGSSTTSAPAAPPATEEALHPSWQARKKQQTGIVAFQGTKITF